MTENKTTTEKQKPLTIIDIACQQLDQNKTALDMYRASSIIAINKTKYALDPNRRVAQYKDDFDDVDNNGCSPKIKAMLDEQRHLFRNIQNLIEQRFEYATELQAETEHLAKMLDCEYRYMNYTNYNKDYMVKRLVHYAKYIDGLKPTKELDVTTVRESFKTVVAITKKIDEISQGNNSIFTDIMSEGDGINIVNETCMLFARIYKVNKSIYDTIHFVVENKHKKEQYDRTFIRYVESNGIDYIYTMLDRYFDIYNLNSHSKKYNILWTTNEQGEKISSLVLAYTSSAKRQQELYETATDYIIDKLNFTEKQGKIFYLLDTKGFSTRDIARAVGCSQTYVQKTKKKIMEQVTKEEIKTALTVARAKYKQVH